MDDRFAIGEVYFRIKYAEPGRKYPLIDSFVYVGKNLSDEDVEDTWYFQFADSYAKHGSILAGSGGDRRVSCLVGRDLGDMLDDQQLLERLAVVRQRRLEK
jgi:hypothetical protein